MEFSEKDFKKLLIDLETSNAEVARAIGISDWAVKLYFRGELTSKSRRAQIRKFLQQRANAVGVRLPPFWTSKTAAAS